MADDLSESPSIEPGRRNHADAEALLAEVNALSICVNRVGRGQGLAGGLPSAAYGVLQVLKRYGPQTVPRIARRRSTSRQNIQILINRLRSQGCVDLTSNPAHRRSALVTLTSRGRTLLTQGGAVYGQMLETLTSHISASELAGAMRLLNGIRRLLSSKQPPVVEASGEGKRLRRRAARIERRGIPKQSLPALGTLASNPKPETEPEGEEEFPVSLL